MGFLSDQLSGSSIGVTGMRRVFGAPGMEDLWPCGNAEWSVAAILLARVLCVCGCAVIGTITNQPRFAVPSPSSRSFAPPLWAADAPPRKFRTGLVFCCRFATPGVWPTPCVSRDVRHRRPDEPRPWRRFFSGAPKVLAERRSANKSAPLFVSLIARRPVIGRLARATQVCSAMHKCRRWNGGVVHHHPGYPWRGSNHQFRPRERSVSHSPCAISSSAEPFRSCSRLVDVYVDDVHLFSRHPFRFGCDETVTIFCVSV